MDFGKLRQFLENRGELSYRYKQIEEAYFGGKYAGFDQITNLSKDLRQALENTFEYWVIRDETVLKGKDSFKAKLELLDGKSIETVLMKYKDFNSVCVSSQIGCAMGCKFCATGKMGLVRNLSVDEIVQQVLFWIHKGFGVDRIVFMGMGEPMNNWNNVKQAIYQIHDKIGIGWRKISVSTVGVPDGINKFETMEEEINLAISLHSLDQDVRKKIIPSATNYELGQLTEDVKKYVNKSKRQVFFEYALMSSINDGVNDAYTLANFINSNHLYYLNLINLNNVDGCSIKPSIKFNEFSQILDKNRVKYTIRKSAGKEIRGACGQLISENII